MTDDTFHRDDSFLYEHDYSSVYDRIFSDSAQVLEVVDFLESNIDSKDSRILELGAGTGRITIPLAERGYVIDAVELSRDMYDLLEKKSCGIDNISTYLDDMCTWRPRDSDGEIHYDLIYCVLGTFGCLPSELEQDLFFRNVSSLMGASSLLVMEIFDSAVFERIKNSARGMHTLIPVIGEEATLESVYEADGDFLRISHTWLEGNAKTEFDEQVRIISSSKISEIAGLHNLEISGHFNEWKPSQGMKDPSAVSIFKFIKKPL